MTEFNAATTLSSRITIDHFVLALLQEGRGVGVSCLKILGLDMSAARRLAEREQTPSPVQSTPQSLHDSEVIQSLLAGANAASDLLGHRYVGSEHLVLSIYRKPDQVPAALAIENVGYADVEACVRRTLGEA